MLVVVLLLILGFFCSSSHAFTHNNNNQHIPQQRQHTHISAVQIEESHRTTRQHTLEKKQQQNDQASQLDELFQRTPPHVVEVLPEPIPSRIEICCEEANDEATSSSEGDDATSNKAEGDNAGTERADEANDQDEDDNELVDEIQERRKLAARAALLGRSRRGPTTTRKAGATTQRKQSNKASTSVGARRVGSATKARQGPGVTKRFMDAVRKSATTANPKYNDKDDKENPSETTPPSAVLNNKRTLSPSALHERVLELMETKKRAGYTAATSTTNTQSQGPRPFLPRRYTTATQPASPLELFPTNKPKQQSDEQSPAAGTVLVPPSTQVTTTTPTTTDTNKSNSNNNHKLQFPECLTVRVATTRSDTEVANLRLSVFSDFTPDVRRQLVSRSVRAVVTRRALGATCLIATVPPSLAARKRNRPPVILGSAECSFHEFEGTTLGRCRPTGSILYITEVAVSPNARRRGIGGKLLEAIDVLGNTREIETLYLHVDVENTGALALYEKAGFRKVDRSDPMFLEFTTKLNLHDGATKGRNHFLLYKNLVQCPTWLPESTTVPVVPAEFPQPPSGTLGFEVPC